MILLVSGGLDSFIAGQYLLKEGYNLRPLYINYKGKYTDKEEAICKKLYQNLLIDHSLNFKKMEHGDNAFIKNRNAHFALIASNYSNQIIMGGLKDDNVGDKSQEAFYRMTQLLNEINNDDGTYTVFSPFWRKTKSDIVRWYCKTGLPIKHLVKTTSCYHPTEHFCSECPSCFRKWCAFNDNQIESYLPVFKNIQLVEKYEENVTFYNKQRQDSILLAAKKLKRLS